MVYFQTAERCANDIRARNGVRCVQKNSAERKGNGVL